MANHGKSKNTFSFKLCKLCCNVVSRASNCFGFKVSQLVNYSFLCIMSYIFFICSDSILNTTPHLPILVCLFTTLFLCFYSLTMLNSVSVLSSLEEPKNTDSRWLVFTWDWKIRISPFSKSIWNSGSCVHTLQSQTHWKMVPLSAADTEPNDTVFSSFQ